jgi:hypothetical protein
MGFRFTYFHLSIFGINCWHSFIVFLTITDITKKLQQGFNNYSDNPVASIMLQYLVIKKG